MSVTISGSAVSVVAGTLSVTDSIGQRSVGSLVVFDQFGAADYQANQSVVMTDDSANVIFSGFIATSKKIKPGQPSTLYHEITLKDLHFLADKRIAATSYVGQTCGQMVADLVTNWLAAEGVSVLNSPNMLSVNQANVETSTTGFSVTHDSLLTGTPDATMSRDTAFSWQGVSSLHVLTPTITSGSSGAEINPGFAVTNGHTYTISFYERRTVGGGALRLYDFTNSSSPYGGLTLPSPISAFQRITYTFTASVTSSDLRFAVRTSTSNQDIWLDGLQVEEAASASAWQVPGGQSIQAGPIVTPHVVNYMKVSKALDELALLAGFYWYIDAAKVLHFYLPGTEVAPWVYDGTQAIDFDYPAHVESSADLYRNAQYMLGATEITSTQTDIRKGDAQTRTFTLNFPVHQVPTISTNIAGAGYVAKTVGILGVDTGKDFYWNKGSPIITQDNGGTVLNAVDLMKAVYIGEYKSIAYSTDSAQITIEQGLEGGGTSGIVEDVQTDPSLITTARAFQSANALLAKYGLQARTVTFTTRQFGLAAGQVLTINLPAPWNLSGVQGLIESVQISTDDFSWLYTVTCIVGPVNTNWVQFFHALANQQPIIDQTLGGQSSTVALVQNVNESWTWTETVTEPTVACALFTITFPKTLC